MKKENIFIHFTEQNSQNCFKSSPAGQTSPRGV